MKKITSVLFLIPCLWSCTQDDLTPSKIDNDDLGKSTKVYIPNIQSEITVTGNMLYFKSENDFFSLLDKVQTSNDKPISRSFSNLDLGYNQIQESSEFKINVASFKSLQDEFDQAMNEAELYCDTEEGYAKFKSKYPSLYFPEQPDDYSAYLPVSNPSIAKFLNSKGEIKIGGEIKNLRDITSYSQLIALDLIPEDNDKAITKSANNAEDVNYFYNRCNNRKLWVRMRLAAGSSFGVYQDIIADVSFRKKGVFGAWYNYSSETSIGWVPYQSAWAGEWSKSGYSSHDYKWARIYSNGKPVPFKGKMWVQFRGFGSKCGGTKYEFNVNI